MGTADFVAGVGVGQTGRPLNGAAADGLWRSVSHHDPIQAQNLMCLSIGKLLEGEAPNARQLEALFVLDRNAETLSRQLLNLYVDGDAQQRPFERSFWIAALRLSQSFFQAYEHFLRHLRISADAYLLTHAHAIVVQLFDHRQTEFILRFIRFKKRIPGQWKELHEAYRFARKRGIAMHSVGANRDDDTHEVPTTPEQQFIRLLLLEALNDGQFSPREALWADRWFKRWCKVVHLQSPEVMGRTGAEQKAFVVDLDATDGLQWAATATVGNPLFLDPSPLVAMIDKELQLLRAAGTPRGAVASAGSAGQLALLDKLKAVFDPSSSRVARLEERTSVDQAVQTIFSACSIIQVLRDEAIARTKEMPREETQLERIASPALGTTAYASPIAVGAIGRTSIAIADNAGVVPEVWQLRDRSDSGSRLRGQIDDLNRIIPGSLVAFRESDDAPWTVSVVRRFRRLMVDHVEIGVEHIGRSPRFVKLVTEWPGGPPSVEPADTAQRCFAALYLPPSERQPTMPINTLLLPAYDFKADSTITLLSSDATYTLRLNEPIQHQFEFIWTSFTVVDKADVTAAAE
jgi:hypothetical protein